MCSLNLVSKNRNTVIIITIVVIIIVHYFIVILISFIYPNFVPSVIQLAFYTIKYLFET